MGLVCRYRDTKLDRLVAVKALPPPFAQDPQWRDQFIREAKALASLDHANIAKIHHVVEHAGADFLILEYVPGRTLAGELADGPLPLARALSIALRVARAIEAGHGVALWMPGVSIRMICPSGI